MVRLGFRLDRKWMRGILVNGAVVASWKTGHVVCPTGGIVISLGSRFPELGKRDSSRKMKHARHVAPNSRSRLFNHHKAYFSCFVFILCHTLSTMDG